MGGVGRGQLAKGLCVCGYGGHWRVFISEYVCIHVYSIWGPKKCVIHVFKGLLACIPLLCRVLSPTAVLLLLPVASLLAICLLLHRYGGMNGCRA